MALAFSASVGVAVSAYARSSPLSGVAAAQAVLVALAAAAFLWHRRQNVAAQESLRRVKLLAHDILASMEQGVVTTDNEARVTSINSGAVRLLGASEECVGHPLARLASAEVPLDGICRQVLGRHEPVRDRECAVQREGGTRLLLASAHELKDTNGRALGCVIHLRDVTERMRMKEQVWRLERLASLSTLASGLHHEIKNPLTALGIHVQLIEERLRDPNAPEPVGELLAVLKSEVRRLNGVLERFRDYASLPRLCLSPTDVPEVLDDVARLIRPQAEAQGVRMSLARDGKPPPRVPLDAEKFREAVLNLVVNALEAMPGGGELLVGARSGDGALTVEVRDTGPGIPPEVLEQLFKPYVSTKPRGTGMGLAMVEKLVSQHGGRVTFQTGPRGTTFQLSLPLSARVTTGGDAPP
jgi:PAS domain S-box-containing protein